MFCICFVYPFYMLSLCQGYPDDKVAIPTETKTNNLKNKKNVKNKQKHSGRPER